MAQHSVPEPTVTSGPGYGLLYATYLHSAAWVLRKGVATMTGTGESFDKVVTLDTRGLGEDCVRISVCLPKEIRERNTTAPVPLLVVAEGGGFVLGQPTDGEHIIRPLSDHVNAVVVSVDYAKSPRYPYPHALLQIYEVILWATSPQSSETLGVAIDSSRVAIMGNSAGGNLTAALTLLLSFTSGPCAKFRDRLPRSFKLAGQIMLYPGLACNRPYLDRYKAAEETVRAASLPVWAASLMEAAYLPPYIEKQQIFIAPVDTGTALLQSLNLPPTLCITAGKDCLKLEAEAYIGKLRDAGVEVLSYEYPDAIHGFSHHKKDFKDDRESCWGHVGQFLSKHLAG